MKKTTSAVKILRKHLNIDAVLEKEIQKERDKMRPKIVTLIDSDAKYHRAVQRGWWCSRCKSLVQLYWLCTKNHREHYIPVYSVPVRRGKYDTLQ